MRVSIYFENKNIDISNSVKIERGNPGLGGTEFQFLQLANGLADVQGKKPEIEIHLISNKRLAFREDIKYHEANSLVEAFSLSRDVIGSDFFIYRPRVAPDLHFFDEVNSSSVKVIPWIHITPSRESMDIMYEISQIPVCVFVGRDQRYRWKDHKIWRKAITIFNSYPKVEPRDTHAFGNQEIVYLGALVPAKGFHVLAEVWPKILAKNPQAILNVIGSGNLYDHNASMGDFGIAEKSYEAKILHFLTKKSSEVLKSVRFHGRMGIEKQEILRRSCLGVINPTGQTENCPLSAIELQMHGIPLVTSTKYGMRDMVIHGKSGFQVKSKRKLINRVSQLLADEHLNSSIGRFATTFANERFSVDKMVESWLRVFESTEIVANEDKEKFAQYYLYKLSAWLREFGLIRWEYANIEDLRRKAVKLKMRFFGE